ncbi:hypothetical protein EDC19_0716 [Natranaerovirga hydrolytica]|uniref:Purine nucleoside phosphorylase n=1 Tax=Natranaerovirga hydrolytica TaxID=680378 RepID=A0A4R1MYJ4_9FIRM|nr:peptidoglycan editing factor PgeF [Natranaerovirga hydrolytica]TCK98296.1 hypothetical protein EDC19_0716 [Natranaerovirga hydrolytica]
MNSKTLRINEKDNVMYITIPSFEATNCVKHCFTTRLGGVSDGYFSSLNLGYNRGDLDSNVVANYKIICDTLDISYDQLFFSDQVHKDNVYAVTKKDINHPNSKIKEVDALITNEKDIPLVTFYADCVPIYFLDPIKKVIGLAHAGWRGTVKKIPSKTIQKMIETYDCLPQDILIGIGPSIGKCCYEVSEDVATEFINVFSSAYSKKIIQSTINHKFKVDLWQANRYTLLEAGILEKNITVTDLCTQCHKDVFFSHRATNGKRGNMAAIMALNG